MLGVGTNKTLIYSIKDTIYIYKNGIVEKLKYFDGFKGDTYYNIGAMDQYYNIWIKTDHEIAMYDGNKWNTFDYYLNNQGGISDMTIDTRGNIWTAESNRVSYFDGKNWKGLNLRELGLGYTYLHSTTITTDAKGNIWVGGESNLLMYDGDSWQKQSYYYANSSDRVSNILADSGGNVWISAGNKLLKFDQENWLTYTAEDGLLVNKYISSIAISRTGEKIIVTDLGISILNDNVKSKPFSPILAEIKGYSFWDDNKNGKRDNVELLLPKQYFNLVGLNKTFTSWHSGYFTIKLQDSSYTLKPSLYKYFLPTTDSINFTIRNGISDKELSFGYYIEDNKAELSIDIIGNATRAFF